MIRFGAAALAALVCALPSFAGAQDAPTTDTPLDGARPQGEIERDEERDEDLRREEAREAADDDATLIRERDYSASDPEPPARPDFGDEPDFSDGAEVARDAGVGSPLAYGRQTVLELGGTFLFSHRSETTEFGAAPSLGYFLFDGFEVTLFALFRVLHVSGDDQAPAGTPEADGQTDFVFQPLIEPSYHLVLTDGLYAFAGAGLGLTIAEEPVVDFVVRPRIGLDVLIGRSAIFKPAFFMDLGVADGLGAIGVEAGFSAMW
jgi:hypothetical protein